MKTKTKFIIITIMLGIFAMAFGRTFWPPSPEIPQPTSVQLPFFIFLAIVEALFFGFGIAFIIYGWPLVRRATPEIKKPAIAAFIALSWLLVSWWPHDNLHMHNGMDLQGLLYIEYGFHFTLIIAALVLVWAGATFFKSRK